MTHDTKAARLADKAKRLADDYAKGVGLWSHFESTIDALRDLAIPAGEAVAWRVSHPVSGDIFRDTEPDSGVYPPSYTVTPLYASPQPTPEASQDGARATVDITLTADETSFLRAFMGEDEGECPDAIRLQLGDGHDGFGLYVSLAEHPEEGSSLLTSRAALRSPLPGRESTAQAGAATESSSERSSGCLNSSGLAQTLTSETTSPSGPAMREALQRIADMRDRDGNAIEMHREELRGIARAALASPLPEPRAGEAGDDVLLRFLCDLHANLPEAVRPMGWSDFSDEQAARARKAWVRALAASPIATPTRPTLTERLQQKCSDWKTYWRAPDAHGVNLSVEQATELLVDALGVEVDIATPKPHAATELLDYEQCKFEACPCEPQCMRGECQHPATPKPQEREPLTDAQRESLYDQRHNQAFTYRDDFYAGIEAAERHHGIVPQDGDRGEGEMAE